MTGRGVTLCDMDYLAQLYDLYWFAWPAARTSGLPDMRPAARSDRLRRRQSWAAEIAATIEARQA